MLPVHDESDVRYVEAHAERTGGDDSTDSRENPAVKPPLKVVTPGWIVSLGVEELQTTPRSLSAACTFSPSLTVGTKMHRTARRDLREKTLDDLDTSRIFLRVGEADQGYVRSVRILDDDGCIGNAHGFAYTELHLRTRRGGEGKYWG